MPFGLEFVPWIFAGCVLVYIIKLSCLFVVTYADAALKTTIKCLLLIWVDGGDVASLRAKEKQM